MFLMSGDLTGLCLYIYKFEEFESMLLQKLEYFNDVK